MSGILPLRSAMRLSFGTSSLRIARIPTPHSAHRLQPLAGRNSNVIRSRTIHGKTPPVTPVRGKLIIKPKPGSRRHSPDPFDINDGDWYYVDTRVPSGRRRHRFFRVLLLGALLGYFTGPTHPEVSATRNFEETLLIAGTQKKPWIGEKFVQGVFDWVRGV